jgi:hypothetical protein
MGMELFKLICNSSEAFSVGVKSKTRHMEWFWLSRAIINTIIYFKQNLCQ